MIACICKRVSSELSHSGSWLHHEIVDQLHTVNNAQCSTSCVTVIPGYNHNNPIAYNNKTYVLSCYIECAYVCAFSTFICVYVYNSI